MVACRTIVFFEDHFFDFFSQQSESVKEKIDEVLYLISVLDRVPSKFLKKIEGVKGLFEIRIEFQSNIYRIFCCFDKGKLVILFNGFQKKSGKTPKVAIEKAERLMSAYFNEQKNQ